MQESITANTPHLVDEDELGGRETDELKGPTSDVVECVVCSALLPLYAKYCFICGTSQAKPAASEVGSPIAEEFEQLDAVVDDDLKVKVEPTIFVEPDPVPVVVESEQDRHIRELRNQQKKIGKDITTLERDRFWWKKYL